MIRQGAILQIASGPVVDTKAPLPRTSQSDTALINPLKNNGLLDHASIEKAREEAKRRGCNIADAVLLLRLVTERDFLKVFADLYATRFLKAEALCERAISLDLCRVMSREDATALRICPLHYDAQRRELQVVATVPLAASIEAKTKAAAQVKSVVIFVATSAAVKALQSRVWDRDATAFAHIANGTFLRASDDTIVPPSRESPSELTPLGTQAFPTQRGAVASKPGPPVELNATEPLSVIQEAPTESKTVMVSLETITIESLKKENARYRMAQEFNKRVSLERSMSAMVDRILSVTFELFPCERAAVWLNDGTWRSSHKNGGDDRADIPQRMIDAAVESKAGILTQDALIDARFDRSKSVMLRGIRSAMAVPLRTATETVGVLYVDSVAMTAAFQENDLAVFDALGAQAALMIENAGLVAQIQREVETRASLSRFLSPAAVEEVVSGKTTMNMSGTLAPVTVLFADIRGFTTMSAHMAAPEVVKFLNDFFAEALGAVENHFGIVDKFIGDSVMGLWGALRATEADARNAINAALELVQQASKILVDGVPLEIGVGINSGMAVVGAIGGQRRLDYTAIGATVNLAARLCSIAPAGNVLITSDTLLQAGPGVEVIPEKPVILKGLEVPMVPYRVKSVSRPLQLLKK
jgi:class 3 adenylate cyclase